MFSNLESVAPTLVEDDGSCATRSTLEVPVHCGSLPNPRMLEIPKVPGMTDDGGVVHVTRQISILRSQAREGAGAPRSRPRLVMVTASGLSNKGYLNQVRSRLHAAAQ